uniref:NodB homology domain-containing protein n=1 Tax=Octactis speculum TaxID=3111310 RepID=A0A7S2B8U1_9STRA|mmetsp:Transcript_20734/g.28201  ORF Transcript_20734/g.28201 Transcript_20734/m.28201 type:complete len:504 (+) Transcript_20734:495-2006(+)
MYHSRPRVVVVEGLLLLGDDPGAARVRAEVDHYIVLDAGQDPESQRALWQRKYRRSHLGKRSYLERGVTEEAYQVYWESYVEPRWRTHGSNRVGPVCSSAERISGGFTSLQPEVLRLNCLSPPTQSLRRILATVPWFGVAPCFAQDSRLHSRGVQLMCLSLTVSVPPLVVVTGALWATTHPLSGSRDPPFFSLLTPALVIGGAAVTVMVVVYLAYWFPQWLVALLQGCFDRREVVFFFPDDNFRTCGGRDDDDDDGGTVTTLPPVALTIDDSPSNFSVDSTNRILDVLSEHGAKATFMIISSQINTPERAATVKRMVSEGHELGNHGTIDRPAVKLSLDGFIRDTESAQAVIDAFLTPTSDDALHEEPKKEMIRWYRPGHGIFTGSMKSWLSTHNYRVAIANVYPHDANDLPPTQSSSPGLNAWHLRNRTLRAGSILLVHDRPWTPKTLALSLPSITSRFAVVTLSELSKRTHEAEDKEDRTSIHSAPHTSKASPSAILKKTQ